jgi:hypothetical protein
MSGDDTLNSALKEVRRSLYFCPQNSRELHLEASRLTRFVTAASKMLVRVGILIMTKVGGKSKQEKQRCDHFFQTTQDGE